MALAVDLLAGVVIAAVAALHGASLGAAVAVDFALVAAAWGIGSPIGARVQDPGHLLPACVVAACADIVSVVSPHGPSHAIAASERALAVFTVSFAVPGTHAFAPALGAGDLIFLALVLGAAQAHKLPYFRAVLLASGGVLAAALLSRWTQMAVPALPTIGAAVLAGLPETRRLKPKDRNVATIAIAVAVSLAALTIAQQRGWMPGSVAE